MENWCYHKPTLVSFAKHYQTGVPLTDDMCERLKAARIFRSGTDTLRQVRGIRGVCASIPLDSNTCRVHAGRQHGVLRWSVHHRPVADSGGRSTCALVRNMKYRHVSTEQPKGRHRYNC